ncbi:hypothetical protein ACIOEX_22655 [Streptomyces sp. NPDC087850]|uniref:hypothetical protein n=1 Tax=Streptomyces sp. NPDC087850 TaxID=3365809 RepID=UPI0038237139
MVHTATGSALQLRRDPARLTGGLVQRRIEDPTLCRSWGDRLTRLTLRTDPSRTPGGPPVLLRLRIERAG